MFKLAKNQLPRDRALRVALVGCGGTGSHLLTGLTFLHTAMEALWGHGLEVHAFDPDTVSESNLVRQRFVRGDIGQNKAVTLISRVNATLGVYWHAYPLRFEAVQGSNWDLVITCVDSRAARQKVREMVTTGSSRGTAFWLDCGNDAHIAQVVLGQPRNAVNKRSRARGRLPISPELFPEIADTRVPEVDTPSCSVAESLQRQDLFVNDLTAKTALNLLWRALNERQLAWHVVYLNLMTGSSRAQAVPEQPERKRRQAKAKPLPEAAD